ncbi:MAG: methyltransferase domain-containing protein [Chitinophagaceae bacterium]|nr:methyltransferase domain-containing protein [Chitinophagaceae bacterium]
MYLLIPGRHPLLTKFQQRYLTQLINKGLHSVRDIYGNPVQCAEPVDAVIFAVTSANHSNTRRNPLPFYLRAIIIEAMAEQLQAPVYMYGIDDVGSLPGFAEYTIKRIKHESDGFLNCTPQNTLVICSTPVLRLYEALGFSILPAELGNINTWEHTETMPWDLVEHIAGSSNWLEDDFVKKEMNEAAYKVWKKYRLGERVQLLFKDHMISSDGDLTETRDYNVYVRQMDDIAGLKYNETARFLKPGRIGDIGCAVGSWIKLAAMDENLRESDLYGIEVSRHLFEICRQRKENGEFKNPFVFFSQKNAVTGLVFDKDSMNTIHTSSLTHEIESYGSREDLLQFIKNRYLELAPGGVWVNRDVVAPFDKDKQVYMQLAETDGANDDPYLVFNDREAFSDYLQSLSTYARFLRFAKDFRATEGYRFSYEKIKIEGQWYLKLALQDAAEFLSRKDYTDNWQSEMHETFCFWDFNDWKEQLSAAGFHIHPDSSAFTNSWIVNNRWKGKAALFEWRNGGLIPVDFPVTHMILVGMKA